MLDTKAELFRAVLLWLPGGTIVPFLLSKLTGADTRTALVEATIFALGGLLVYPTLLGLLSARFVDWYAVDRWIEVLFVGGFLLAAATLVALRRANRHLQRTAGNRRWRQFR